MALHTTDSLINRVRRRTATPSGRGSWVDAAILDELSVKLRGPCATLMLEVQQGYSEVSEDVPLVSGQAKYAVPARAVGAALRVVGLVTEQGRVTPLYPESSAESMTGQDPRGGTPKWFTLRGQDIIVRPVPDTGLVGWQLRLVYMRRPNQLVLPAAVAVVQSVDTGTGVVTATAPIPGTFLSGIRYDVLGPTPPAPWRTANALASAVGASTVTLPAASVASVVPGDYLCLADQSPVPQCPEDMIEMLVGAVVQQIQSGRDDSSAWQKAAVEYKQQREDAMHAVAPNRASATPSTILNRWL